MIGSPYEFDQGDKTKNFELFIKENGFDTQTIQP